MLKVLIDIPEQYLKLIHSDSPINWVSMSGFLNFVRKGIVLDNLTNGEVAEKVFDVAFSHIYLEDLVDGYGYASNDECLICDHNWFDRKWGE